jgi:hypothetical protein
MQGLQTCTFALASSSVTGYKPFGCVCNTCATSSHSITIYIYPPVCILIKPPHTHTGLRPNRRYKGQQCWQRVPTGVCLCVSACARNRILVCVQCVWSGREEEERHTHRTEMWRGETHSEKDRCIYTEKERKQWELKIYATRVFDWCKLLSLSLSLSHYMYLFVYAVYIHTYTHT